MYIVRCYEKVDSSDLIPDGKIPITPFDKKTFSGIGEAKGFTDKLIVRLQEKRERLGVTTAVIEVIEKKTKRLKYYRKLLLTGEITDSPPLV
jgi:hypothetical protein